MKADTLCTYTRKLALEKYSVLGVVGNCTDILETIRQVVCIMYNVYCLLVTY